MAHPLDGIRVLDFTMFQQGPQATMMLADMGAEVLKVEGPVFGDLGRHLAQHGPEAVSSYFLAHTRGKKSITINLTRREGKEIVRRLVKRSDVLAHNFRPGVMERLGLAYDDVKAMNPGIIYAHASGWGSKGPKASHPAFDVAAQARAGLVGVTGEPDGYPLPAGAAVADYAGAMNLALGVLAALLVRERTGVGQQVESSLLGASVAMQGWEIQTYLLGRMWRKAGRGHPYLPTIWRVFKTADAYAVVGGMPENRWPAFCRAVGKPELQHDPRFHNFFARRDHLDELYAILDDIFLQRTTAEWMNALESADMICAPVATYADVVSDPQVLENDYILTVDHPNWGPMQVVGSPLRFSETQVEVQAAAPEMGQHTEETLLELGYTWEDIAALREHGVI
jgi:CoA:oxalate CoA-transferase